MENLKRKLDYIKNYFDNNEDRNNIEILIKRAKEILPSMKLYKYRSGFYKDDGTNYDLQNILENKIRITNIKDFNDPFEGRAVSKDLFDAQNKRYEEISKRYEKDKEFFKKYKETFIDKIHEVVITGNSAEFFKEVSICSFSGCNDNILMWSHYSNCHKGFCIEYDFEQLIRNGAIIFPVIYSEEVPDINDRLLNNPKYYTRIYTKALDWEYEKEWRLLCVGKQNGENLSIDKPKSIYLGCKIEERLEKDLLRICKEKDIKCYKGVIDYYKYKLNFKEI